jgi:hypothetical protein
MLLRKQNTKNLADVTLIGEVFKVDFDLKGE